MNMSLSEDLNVSSHDVIASCQTVEQKEMTKGNHKEF